MNHYLTVFRMVQDHHWNWNDIQSMVPFERDINVILLRQWIEEKLESAKQRAT